MSSTRRSLQSFILATACLLASSSGAHASSPLPLALLPLQLDEVPAGFHLSASGVSTNLQEAQANGVSLRFVQGLGRVTGYENDYARSTKSGMCCILSDVVVYKSAADARRAYLWHIDITRRTYGSYPGYAQASSSHGTLSIQSFPCACPEGTTGILKLKTYKGKYYVFTQVDYLVHGADPKKILTLAVHYAVLVRNRVP